MIANFRVTPKDIQRPSWSITGTPQYPIIENMQVIIDFLVFFAETNFFLCLLDNLGGWIPYRLVEIPKEAQSKDCPVRYTLEIDLSKIPGPPQSGGGPNNQAKG